MTNLVLMGLRSQRKEPEGSLLEIWGKDSTSLFAFCDQTHFGSSRNAKVICSVTRNSAVTLSELFDFAILDIIWAL